MLKLIKRLFIICILLGLEVSAVVAGDLKEIQHRGKLRVGIKDNLPPLGFYDSQGILSGLEIDIAREIAQELLGSPEAVEFYPLLNQDRLDTLLEGKVDIVIADMAATTSRRRLVAFSDAYYLDGTGLMTANPQIKTIRQLEGKKIAILGESSAVAVLKYRIPTARLVNVQSYQEGLDLLQSNQVDAMAADYSILVGWREKNPVYYLLPEKLSIAPLAVVLPKGIQYNELQQRVTTVIKTSKESGWLKQRLDYWGLP